jgi:hypothetical protein
VAHRLSAGLVLAALLALAPSGVAQTPDGCSISFNGVNAERIDSLASPLELGPEDTLTASGSDPVETRTARLRLSLGPIDVGSGRTTYAAPTIAFTAAISLQDVRSYGVGLLRAEVRTDGCLATAWVRISGGFPPTTLVGLVASGLAIGGLTGQLGAIALRRRWARTAAAIGGVATGTGLALLGQQLGRFQISYPSLAASWALASLAGFIAASAFNPARRSRGRSPATIQTPLVPRSKAASTSERRASSAGDGPRQRTSTSRRTAPTATPGSETATWCYVLADAAVFDLQDHETQVATLVPGTWYRVVRSAGGWTHVVAGDGLEGWVAASALRNRA